MNILVCVKQVPDTTEIKIDPVTNTLIRAGVPSIVNPFDAYALEVAVRLKESVGGKVTVVSMGPEQAKNALKECLAVGADQAYLVSGREFGGSDTLATSYVLSCAVRALEEKEGAPFDLIFCGKQAIDGDTGQVGPELAEHLDCAQITYASDAVLEDGKLKVKRESDEGYDSQNASDWYEATSLCSAQPSPLSGFDMFNYMALIVCMRGKPECGMTFRKLKEELLGKIERGECGLKGADENFRIMWDGIACWPYLSHTYKTLKNYGVNMTGSTYPSAWALRYTPGNLEEMARAYTGMGNNLSLQGQIDLRKSIIQETKCDGVVMHMNRSCKMCDFLQYEIGQDLQKSLHIPITTFDGDQADPRNYSKAQYETRIEALVEMMEERKNG